MKERQAKVWRRFARLGWIGCGVLIGLALADCQARERIEDVRLSCANPWNQDACVAKWFRDRGLRIDRVRLDRDRKAREFEGARRPAGGIIR